jgi:hypothetical protein
MSDIKVGSVVCHRDEFDFPSLWWQYGIVRDFDSQLGMATVDWSVCRGRYISSPAVEVTTEAIEYLVRLPDDHPQERQP